MEINTYRDPDRSIEFQVGDIVHWYKYSQDSIIIDGGYGLLVSMFHRQYADTLERVTCSVLLSSGNIGVFSPRDLDLETQREDECLPPEKW